jgi:hypothetical protein
MAGSPDPDGRTLLSVRRQLRKDKLDKKFRVLFWE